MRKKKRYVFLMVILLLLGLLSVHSVALGSNQGAAREKGTSKIFVGYIVLTEEHRFNLTDVSAFIPTDSASPICLATLAESGSAVTGWLSSVVVELWRELVVSSYISFTRMISQNSFL